MKSTSKQPTLSILLLLFSSLFLSLTHAEFVSAPDSPSYTNKTLFRLDILNATNAYRAEYNATDLDWNTTLADFASDYLDENGCDFEHSGGPYGENLARGYPNATASIAAWGDEAKKYKFGDPGFTHSTGHFTQLVWKDTTTVGCARRDCGDEKGWFVVCEYWPRGNVIGSFGDEVDRPVDGAGSRDGAPAVWTVVMVGAAYFLVQV